MNPDNEVRGQAETVYNETKTNQPNQIVQALLQVGRTSTTQDLRAFAIILLRQALVNFQEKSLWTKITPQTQALVKRELLNGIEREDNSYVRSNLCDATYELASEIYEAKESWAELLDWLLRLASSNIAHQRQSALLILAHLSTFLVETFSGSQFEVIKNLLSSGLKDRESIKVRLAALDSTTNFIQVFTQQPFRNELQTLLSSMLEILGDCLNQKDEDNAQSALKLFIDLAELDPGFFKPNISSFLDAMTKIGQATELDDSTRQLAVEFLVTFVENKPSICKQLDEFIRNLIALLLQMMLDVEEISIQEWVNQEDNEDALEILNSVVAQENLDRVCLALAGESIVPIIFEHISKFLNNKSDWKFRHVALMALSMIGEGCCEYLMPNLDHVVAMIIPGFEDEHPRVRWATANTAGQMSTDFGPKFQKRYHQEILSRFIKMMDDQNPKVQSHTAAAIVNFCEKFDANLIKPYLDGLLSKLMVLMQSGRRIVQEQAITAIASIAGCAGKHFIPYYDTFVPILKEILIKVQAKEFRMLRGKAMECISLIGIAVGKEKFMQDAHAVMEILAKTQEAPMDTDDPQREFMLQSWTRIATCLGEDFIPYLKFVIPPLLKSADLTAGIHILDPNTPTDDDEPGWEYVDVGDAKIAIHTSALEEKATACNMLYCYASEMKDGFFPYVEEVSKLLVPLMSFYYHDGVRLASLSTMAQLLLSTKLYLEKNKKDPSYLTNLFSYIYSNLMDAVSSEVDQEVLVVGIEAIHECISEMGPNCLSAEKVSELVRQIKLFIIGTQQRRAELVSRNPDADIDEPYLIREELLKEDDVSNEIAEVIGVLVKNHPETFLQAFQELVPLVIEMLQKGRSAPERQLAICIFDDIVEHTHDRSYPLFPHFCPLVLEYAVDPHPGVRQAACFGLGVCVQYGGDVFKHLIPKTLEVLVSVINKPDSRSEKNAPPTENAISSVGKIIQFHPEVLGDKLGQITSMFVNWLPIEVDVIEAKVVHNQLVHFIKTINQHVFGNNFQNLPKVLTIFATILDSNLVEPETNKTIIQILQQMQQQMPGQLLAGAFGAITQENQSKLQYVLSTNNQ